MQTQFTPLHLAVDLFHFADPNPFLWMKELQGRLQQQREQEKKFRREQEKKEREMKEIKEEELKEVEADAWCSF